jgi:putative toxin-antitoxin system antitoxin component (TIGR02293 family)
MSDKPERPLSAYDELDWAARFTHVTARSKQVFAGRPGYSGEWLCTPNPALNGHTPLQALETESGLHAVEDLLVRIEHGLFA